jgi:hypothetical protein
MENEGTHQINMPQKADELSNEDKQIIFEFYNMYSGRQWFNRAEIVLNHPKHMKKTLEVYGNYNPLLEMKEILTFTQRHNIAVEVIDLSHNG